MKKRSGFLIMLAVFFLVQILSAAAIGINPSAIRIEFKPHFEKTYTFTTQKAEGVEVAIEGELKGYAEVVENNIAEDGTFKVKVSLPKSLEGGKHLVFVGITEAGEGGGMVAGRAAVRSPIDIRVPYSGIYIEASLNTPDLNINETKDFTININNLGEKTIQKAKAAINVFDANGTMVEELETGEKKVTNSSRASLEALFNASKHKPGNYRAAATLQYDGGTESLEDSFRVGTLRVELVNHSKRVVKKNIVKFDLEIRSAWNSRIEDVFANVEVSNSSGVVSSFKTVSVSLEPWEEEKIRTFWEIQDMAEGTYRADIELNYEGTTTIERGSIEIMPPKKEESSIGRYFTTTNVLIAAVVLLIMINLAVLLVRRKK